MADAETRNSRNDIAKTSRADPDAHAKRLFFSRVIPGLIVRILASPLGYQSSYMAKSSMVPGLIDASNTPRNVLTAAKPLKSSTAAWHMSIIPHTITWSE